jgi:uncharacterized protein with HEPN domain
MKNQEIFEYIFTSLDFISKWRENSTLEEFENDLMLMDAISYRLYSIGIIAENINISKLEKEEVIVVNQLIEFKIIFSNPNFKISLLSSLIFNDKLGELFSFILNIIVEKFEPKSKLELTKANKLSRDYKYPIITSNSIWTVRRR